MRHGKKVNKLSRKSAHRQAMLANMASSLIMHKRINTTLAKGKALRVYVEPLITKSKNDSTHSRRVVFSYLQNKEAVSELFREVSVKIAERPGGYTRVLKTGTRLGDNAEMCMIELVDYNENLLGTREDTKTKTSRRRRGSGKKKAETTSKPDEDKTTARKTEVAKDKPEVPVATETVAEEDKKESPVAEAETPEEIQKQDDASEDVEKEDIPEEDK